MSSRLMLPREHGAWGMLLVQFCAAAILARTLNLALGVALIASIVAFIVREPLVVLARQRWVWRTPHPETAHARAALAADSAILALCGGLLLLWTPAIPLLAFGAMAAILTATAVYMTVHNRQRSVPLQIASAFGLASTALLVSLVTCGVIENWAWWLWMIAGLHSLAGVLTVHAKLDARTGKQTSMKRTATAFQIIQFALAPAVYLARGHAAFALVLSAGIHLRELSRLAVIEPLKHVGWRALSLSVLHAAILIAALWK